MSLCRILMVRYSRSCPRTMRDSLLTTVPAPWCGYTTLSPTSNKLALPLSAHFTKTAGAERLPARERHSSGDSPCLEGESGMSPGANDAIGQEPAAFRKTTAAQQRHLPRRATDTGTVPSGHLRNGRRGLQAGSDRLTQRLGPRDARPSPARRPFGGDHRRKPELCALLEPPLGLRRGAHSPRQPDLTDHRKTVAHRNAASR